MQVNATKSKFAAQSIEFMGFNLTKNGYKLLHSRVKAILKIAPPNTVRCMWEFIGTINFIKNHIPNQAKLIRPLAKLTKKNTNFNWGPQQQQAFEDIKAQVATQTSRKYFTFTQMQATVVLVQYYAKSRTKNDRISKKTSWHNPSHKYLVKNDKRCPKEVPNHREETPSLSLSLLLLWMHYLWMHNDDSQWPQKFNLWYCNTHKSKSPPLTPRAQPRFWCKKSAHQWTQKTELWTVSTNLTI